MEQQEVAAILNVALMAAFADGMKSEVERESVRRLAETLDPAGSLNLAALYRDVLVGKPELAGVVAPLGSDGARHLAYEMAVGVCDADGVQSPAERDFLTRLAQALALPAAEAGALADEGDAIAAAAVPEHPFAAPAPDSAPATATAGTQRASTLTQAERDKLILDAAVMNAALELLPESLSTLAIIPLQVRLVYRIGRSFGYEMDASHARDFLATVGVGLTSQYLEQAGRKLLGGLLGTLTGGIGRGIGRQAASSGLSFASTWALGRVAERYYAGGRTLDRQTLQSAFGALRDEARALAPRYADEITTRSRSIDPRALRSLVGKF